MGRYSVPADKVCVPSVVLHKPSDLDVTSLAFTPLYGRWSDIFGRKFMLITTLFVFLVFSLACALARTMIQVCYNISSAAYRCSPLCSSLSSVRSKALGEGVSKHFLITVTAQLTLTLSSHYDYGLHYVRSMLVVRNNDAERGLASRISAHSKTEESIKVSLRR